MKNNASQKSLHAGDPMEMCSHVPVAYSLEMQRIIEFEAFLLAEKDGFRRSPLDYWHDAEGLVYQNV